MNLCDYTLLEFMCGHTVGVGGMVNQWGDLKVILGPRCWRSGSEVVVDGRPEFATAESLTDVGDAILLARIDDAWEPIGAYITEAVTIAEELVDKNLSTPLILRAVEKRSVPLSRTLTEAGYGSLRRAWMTAVENCIDANASIRPEVRTSYDQEAAKDAANGRRSKPLRTPDPQHSD